MFDNVYRYMRRDNEKSSFYFVDLTSEEFEAMDAVAREGIFEVEPYHAERVPVVGKSVALSVTLQGKITARDADKIDTVLQELTRCMSVTNGKVMFDETEHGQRLSFSVISDRAWGWSFLLPGQEAEKGGMKIEPMFDAKDDPSK